MSANTENAADSTTASMGVAICSLGESPCGFAGPFMDSMFLVLVCAHSKWSEVVQMKTTTSTKTIEALRMIFCRTGILKQIVSDNGPQIYVRRI